MSALDEAVATAQRGEALAAEGRWDEAAAAFRQVLEVAPNDPLVHNNLGFVLYQGGQIDPAIAAFERALGLDPDHLPAHSSLAFARLAKGDQPGAIESFEAVARLDPSSVQARMALFQLLQVAQRRDEALAHQMAALEICQLFSTPCTGPQQAASILVLKAPGDLQTNIPIDLLFDRTRITLHDLYLLDGRPAPDPAQLPAYDLVFNAISESQRALPMLASAERFIASQDKPVLNPPALVRRLSRDQAPGLFADIDFCCFPRTLRVSRAALLAGPPAAALAAEGIAFPIVIRPLESHAGVDLDRIETAEALDDYLARVAPADYYIAPFVDYRSADGYFRKYRVIFVDGEPYPCHLAISQRWMIHYLNADMAEFAWMRDEEARFLADLANAFAPRALAALKAIAARSGLDYCGMDCAIDREGRVLVFEIDAAMLVHLWDPIDLYPYKHQYVPRIFQAVERMVLGRIAAGVSRAP